MSALPKPSPVSIMLGVLKRRREELHVEDKPLSKRLETARQLLASVSYITIQHRKNPSYEMYHEVETSMKAVSTFVGICDTAIKVHDVRTKNMKRTMARGGFTKHERKIAVQQHEENRPDIKSRELRRLIYTLAYYEDRMKFIQPVN